MKICLLDFNVSEIAAVLNAFGEPAFRARQIFAGLHSGKDFGEMTDIPKSLAAKLGSEYLAVPVKTVKTLEGADGTKKFLFELNDGNIIEGVLMSYKYGNTLCVSTQVGCRMGCAFCASGLDGLIRNLSAGEILGQVVAVNRSEGGNLVDRKVTNVVLMGSGEPLDNFDNTVKFLSLVTADGGIRISPRNISLSTSGIPQKIKELADGGGGVTLTISLHAPTDEARTKLMPITRAHPIAELLEAARYYFEKTGRRVIFEYTLISGVNDRLADARTLAAILRGFPAHVNIIRLNYVKEKGLKPSSAADTKAFLAELEKLKVSATLRRTMGADIEGACGQLRRKFVGAKGD